MKQRYLNCVVLTMFAGCVHSTSKHDMTRSGAHDLAPLNISDLDADLDSTPDAMKSVNDRLDMDTLTDLVAADMRTSTDARITTDLDVTSSDACVMVDQSLAPIADLPPGVYELGFYPVHTTDPNCWFEKPDCIHDTICVLDATAYDCSVNALCSTGSTCMPCTLAHCEFCETATRCSLCADGYQRTDSDQCIVSPTSINCENDEGSLIELNMRVHLMRDDDWVHASGARMNNDHIDQAVITNLVMPDVNRIWKQARIKWGLESIVEEELIHSDTYDADVRYVISAERDMNGRSDPARLPPLYRMMNAEHQRTANQLLANANLFHIDLFPFIGNTGQGNAMRSFNVSTVVSTSSNKRTQRRSADVHCAPQLRPIVEPWIRFEVGSVAQTIAHEVGHVLGLNHDACIDTTTCLMRSNGYTFNADQLCTSRRLASMRTPL